MNNNEILNRIKAARSKQAEQDKKDAEEAESRNAEYLERLKKARLNQQDDVVVGAKKEEGKTVDDGGLTLSRTKSANELAKAKGLPVYLEAREEETLRTPSNIVEKARIEAASELLKPKTTIMQRREVGNSGIPLVDEIAKEAAADVAVKEAVRDYGMSAGSPNKGVKEEKLANVEAAKQALAKTKAARSETSDSINQKLRETIESDPVLNRLVTDYWRKAWEYSQPIGEGQTAAQADALRDAAYEDMMQAREVLTRLGYDADALKDAYAQVANKEETDKIIKEHTEYAKKHPVSATVESIGLNAAGSLSALSGMLESTIKGEDIDTNSPAYAQLNAANALREGVSEDLSPGAQFAYNTGISMADSLLMMPMGTLGTVVMGANALAQTSKDVIDKGGTKAQAWATGLVAGIAETLLEKVSLDQLKVFAKMPGRGFLAFMKNVGKGMVTEGSEELFTEIVNVIGDALINGGNSDIEQRYNDYVKSGMNKDAAWKQTAADYAKQLGLSFLGGAVSGGVFGAGSQLIGDLAQKIKDIDVGKEVRKMGDAEISAQVEEGLKAEDGTEQKRVAEKLNKKLTENEEYTDADVGAVAIENTRARVEKVEAQFAASPELEKEIESADKEADNSIARTAITDLYVRANRILEGEFDLARSSEELDRTADAVRSNKKLSDSQKNAIIKAVDNVKERLTETAESRPKQAESATPAATEVTPEVMAEREARAAKATNEIERSGILSGADDKQIKEVMGIADVFRQHGSTLKVRFSADYDVINGTPNGKYDKATNTIYVNPKAKNPFAQVIAHELVHRMANNSSELYTGFLDAVTTYYSSKGVNFDQLAKQKANEYAIYNIALDEKQSREEVAAEFVEKYIHDRQAIRSLVRKHRSVAEWFRLRLRGLLGWLKPQQTKEARYLQAALDIFSEELRGVDSTGMTPKQRELKAIDDRYASGEITGEEHDRLTQEVEGKYGESYSITKANGNDVVWLDENILKDKPVDVKYTDYIKNVLATSLDDDGTYLNSLPESGAEVYAHRDMPEEFTGSVYTKFLRNKKQDRFRAKMRTATSLGELVQIATGRSWEKAIHSGNKDAKYGIYKYKSRFAFPESDSSGKTSGVRAYMCDLVIINASDGKKYLYDIQNIKEDTITAGVLFSRINRRDSFKSETQTVQPKGIFNNSISQGGTESNNANESVTEKSQSEIDRSINESGEIKNDSGEVVAVGSDNQHVSYSISTYEKSGKDVLRKWLDERVANGDVTLEERNEIVEELDYLYGVCNSMKYSYLPFGAWSDAQVVRGEDGTPLLRVIKPNGEYVMNLDFSLVCKKRRTLDAVFNEIISRGLIDEFELNQVDIARINDVIRDHGFETACALCFVDAKRFRQAKVADDFVNMYNKQERSLAPKGAKIASFDFGEAGIESVDDGINEMPDADLDFTYIDKILAGGKEKTVVYRIASLLKNDASARKLVHRGDFMSTRGFENAMRLAPDVMTLYNTKKGSGGPKAAFGDVQYLNDVLFEKKFDAKKAYEIGGVRVQSFTDYIPRLVFDYVQMIADLAAKKLPAHAYTKEAIFVKQFGLTGMKINMSLVPKIVDGGVAPGLDAEGNYAWADESFDYEEAKRIQADAEYGRNCGTICVGVSDAHIRKLLADSDIRMVIPYHKSGINPLVAAHNRIGEFKDYTKQQNTRYKDGKKLSKEDLSKLTAYNELLRRTGDPMKAAMAYLAECVKYGFTPKFDTFAYETVDGQRRMNPGYYKLLEDFNGYDAGGAYAPQETIKMRFPKSGSAFGSMSDLIKDGLEEDAVLEGRRDAEISNIVDDVTKILGGNANKTGVSYSINFDGAVPFAPPTDEEGMKTKELDDVEAEIAFDEEDAKVAVPYEDEEGNLRFTSLTGLTPEEESLYETIPLMGAAFDAQDVKVIAEENEKLKRSVEYLKGQFKATEGYIPKEQAVRRLIRQLALDYSAKEIDVNRLADRVITVAKEMNSGRIDAREAYDRYVQIAREIIEAQEVQTNPLYEEYAELRNYLRSTGINLNDQYRGDFEEFGGWNEFRKSVMGIMKLSNEGIGVDVAYDEITGIFPGLLDESVINPADQMKELARLANSLRAVYENTFTDEIAEQEAESLGAVIGSQISGLPEAKTYADRMKDARYKAAQDVRDAYRAQLERMNQRTNERLEALETSFREKDATRKLRKELAEKRRQEERIRRDRSRGKYVSLDKIEEAMADGTFAPKMIAVHKKLKEYRNAVHVSQQAGNATDIAKYTELAENTAKYIEAVGRRYRQLRDNDSREALGNFHEWEGKEGLLSGLRYATETPTRIIEDIAPNEAAAKRMLAYAFDPVRKNEANRQRWIRDLRERVKALKIGTKKEGKNANTESEAVQLVGEYNHIIDLLGGKRRMYGMDKGEWQKALDDFKAANPDMNWTEVERKAKAMREIYDEIYDELSNVLVTNGYPPVNKRGGYFPHFSENEPDSVLGKAASVIGLQIQGNELPTSINGLTATFKPGKSYFGNLNRRTGNNTTYDALRGFEIYINGASNVIHHTDDIQRLRSLARVIRQESADPDTKKKIEELVNARDGLTEEQKDLQINELLSDAKFRLAGFVSWLDEYTNGLANKKSKYDRSMEELLGRTIYSLASQLEGRVAANMVALNPGSWLTNFIPLTQARALIGDKYMLKAAAMAVANAARDDGFTDMSDFLVSRKGSDPVVMAMSDRVSSFLSRPMEWIDGFASQTIVRARYMQNVEKHKMSKEAAMAEANVFAGKVMADRSKGATPTIFNSKNPLIKAFTQFQIEQNNQLRYLIKDIPKETEKAQRAILALMSAVMKFAVGAYLFNDLYEYFIGRRPAFDILGIVNNTFGSAVGYKLPNILDAIAEVTGDVVKGEMKAPGEYLETQKKGITPALGEGGIELLESLPFVGGVLGGGRLPIANAMGNPLEVAGEALALIPTVDEETGEVVQNGSVKRLLKTAYDELSKPAYYLLPKFGGGQVKKVIEGTAAVVQHGSYTYNKKGEAQLQYPVLGDKWWETALNWAGAVVFGKTTTPWAREWIENSFKTRTVGETAAYKAMLEIGEQSRDAYAILDKVKEAKAEHSRLEKKGASPYSSGTDAALAMLKADDTLQEISKAQVYKHLLASSDEKEYLYGTIRYQDPSLYRVLTGMRGVTADGEVSAKAKKQELILNSDLSDAAKVKVYRVKAASNEDEDFMDDMKRQGVSEITTLKVITKAGTATKNSEKYKAVSTTSMTEVQRNVFMKQIMTESQYSKYNLANSKGISTAVWAYFTARLEAVNESGAASQQEVAKALAGMNITQNQKAAIWQLQNKGWSAESNPFNPKVGALIKAQME